MIPHWTAIVARVSDDDRSQRKTWVAAIDWRTRAT